MFPRGATAKTTRAPKAVFLLNHCCADAPIAGIKFASRSGHRLEYARPSASVFYKMALFSWAFVQIKVEKKLGYGRQLLFGGPKKRLFKV